MCAILEWYGVVCQWGCSSLIPQQKKFFSGELEQKFGLKKVFLLYSKLQLMLPSIPEIAMVTWELTFD